LRDNEFDCVYEAGAFFWMISEMDGTTVLGLICVAEACFRMMSSMDGADENPSYSDVLDVSTDESAFSEGEYAPFLLRDRVDEFLKPSSSLELCLRGKAPPSFIPGGGFGKGG
jgi:hypothetical protein